MTVHTARQAAYRRGHWAEWVAAAWLMAKGYRLLAHRYKTPGGELDWVVRKRRVLVFVEVKARATCDDAAQALHTKNQMRVVRAAQYFLVQHPQYQDCEVRFDAVLIAWYRWPQHIAHAFTA